MPPEALAISETLRGSRPDVGPPVTATWSPEAASGVGRAVADETRGTTTRRRETSPATARAPREGRRLGDIEGPAGAEPRITSPGKTPPFSGRGGPTGSTEPRPGPPPPGELPPRGRDFPTAPPGRLGGRRCGRNRPGPQRRPGPGARRRRGGRPQGPRAVPPGCGPPPPPGCSRGTGPPPGSPATRRPRSAARTARAGPPRGASPGPRGTALLPGRG